MLPSTSFELRPLLRTLFQSRVFRDVCDALILRFGTNPKLKAFQ